MFGFFLFWEVTVWQVHRPGCNLSLMATHLVLQDTLRRCSRLCKHGEGEFIGGERKEMQNTQTPLLE